jgi:protein TonB
MALPEPRIVSLDELRFRPANSNDRARAGLEHAFTDVPQCSFGRDDGISHYMGADSGIGGFPDTHLNQPPLHDDVPHVGHEQGGLAEAVSAKLARGGFGLSVFLHAVVAVAIGYLATVKLPDEALLAGETVVSLELLSDSEVDAQAAGEKEDVDAPEETPVQQEVVEKERLEAAAKPVEQAKLPEAVEKPVESVEPVVTSKEPEVLATDQPSTFAVEQAARTILDTTDVEPLPAALPKELIAPVIEERPKAKSAQPLPHPISRPRVIQKVAEAEPVEAKLEPKLVEKKPEPVEKKAEPIKKEVKKPEPKIAEKVTEKKKPVEKSRKVRGNQGADESESTRGKTNPRNKGKQNQDASQGDRKNRDIGNAAKTNYKGLVQRKLERAKKRVRVAARGTVIVSFTISANGGVVNLRVRKSSGKPAIDQGALDIVRRASPFPAIPDETGLTSYPVSVPMTFKGS